MIEKLILKLYKSVPRYALFTLLVWSLCTLGFIYHIVKPKIVNQFPKEDTKTEFVELHKTVSWWQHLPI